MHLTILHLSDIQYGRHHVDREDHREPLYPDSDYSTQLIKMKERLDLLSKKNIQPNFIAVTGDIAEWSLAGEYKEAEHFLAGIADHIGIDRRYILMVPGNHDINRKLCQAARLKAEASGKSFKLPYYPKFENYKKFFDKFYKKAKFPDFVQPYKFIKNNLYVNFCFPEQNVLFAGLNSCIDESECDPHHGLITVEQLRKAIKDLDERDPDRKMLRIALMHHNYHASSFHDEENLVDADELKPLFLNGGFHLILHGHQHLSRHEVVGEGGKRIYVLATGSAGLDSKKLPKNSRRYQVIDINNNLVQVHRFRFDDTVAHETGPGCWVRDIRPGQEGLADPFVLENYGADDSSAETSMEMEESGDMVHETSSSGDRFKADSKHFEDDGEAERVKKWKQCKERIERKYPQYIKILGLPNDLPTPQVNIGKLEPTIFFTGREDIFSEIYNNLESRSSVNIYALNGIGGIGKSELAKQITLRLQNNNVFPDGYIWISLESKPREDVWREIGEEFDIPGLAKITESREQLDIIQQVMDATNPFIVLDNADYPESLEKAYAALKGKTLLITSRQPCSIRDSKPMDLEDLTPKDAIDLYLKIYEHSEAPSEKIKNEYPNELEEIANRLSGHPLSIEIIASVANKYQWFPDETVNELRRKGIKALKLPDSDARYKEERHREVRKTFEVALDVGIENSLGSEIDSKTLFVACTALSGEYFHAEEVPHVLKMYHFFYRQECQQLEEEMARKGKKSPNPLMRFLDLEEPEEETKMDDTPMPPPDTKGIDVVHRLLNEPGSIRKMLDTFFSLRLVKKNRPGKGEQTQFSFHPLLREFGWDLLPQFMTDNIWKAVADWTANKAQKLSSDPGDQLQNFRFFLNICMERDLPNAFSTILLSIYPYLYDQGMWPLAIECLELGKNWIEKNTEHKKTSAEIFMKLGDLKRRLGNSDEGKRNLEKALHIYRELKDQNKISWINNWMGALLFPNDVKKRISHYLQNLREATSGQIVNVCSAGFSNVSDLLDSIDYPNKYWSLNRLSLFSNKRRNDLPNLKLRLISLALDALWETKFPLVKRLLFWVDRLQKNVFEVDMQSEYSKEMSKLKLLTGDFKSFQKHLNEYIKAEKLMGRIEKSTSNICYVKGLSHLEKKEYEKALAEFVISEHEWYILLCALLGDISCADDRLKSIPKKVNEEISKCNDSIEVVIYRGLMAAYHILREQPDDLHSAIQLYCRALLYLKTNNHLDYRWFGRLETLIIDEIDDEIYNRIKYGLTDDDIRFSPGFKLFPENLPHIVRSSGDNRLMRLIPAGLCPVDEGNFFDNMEKVWMPQYYLDIHPVTNDEYARFLSETGHKPCDNWKNVTSEDSKKDLPVTGITFDDAMKYCEWAGKALPHIYEIKRAALLDRKIDLDTEWSSEITIEEIDRMMNKLLEKLSDAKNDPKERPWDAGFQPQIDENNIYFRKPSWKNGLSDDISPSAVTGLNDMPESRQEGFLELLSGSLIITTAEKEHILKTMSKFTDEEFSKLVLTLFEEKRDLHRLKVGVNEKVEKLVSVRWNEWSEMVQNRLGLNPNISIADMERKYFSSMDPYDYSPPFDRFFPRGFDINLYLNESLIASEKERAVDFLKHLSDSIIISKPLKMNVIKSLITGIQLYDLLNLRYKMEDERKRIKEEPHRFSHFLVRLQEAWLEWKSIAEFLTDRLKDGNKLFKDLEIFFRMEESLNLFHTLEPWNKSLEIKPDIRCILPAHPDVEFDEHHFLNLIAGSISLTKDEKDRVLESVPRLSQSKIDELIGILTEERKKFGALEKHLWPQLNVLCKKYEKEWETLLNDRINREKEREEIPFVDQMPPDDFDEKEGDQESHDNSDEIPEESVGERISRDNDINLSGIDFSVLEYCLPELRENPFANPPACDRFLSRDLDIRWILPAHPKTFFSERSFIQLLAGSISLTKEEKRRVIEAIPRLSQEQIDELIKILLEEKEKFTELDPENWPQLKQLSKSYWSFWSDLVFELMQFPFLKPVDKDSTEFSYLNGLLKHWTCSKHYQKENHALAGGPSFFENDDEAFYPVTMEGVSDGDKNPLWGFRCCVPIFSRDDMEGLEPFNES